MEEPIFEKPNFSQEEKYLLEPFFTNLERSVYAITFLPPEMVGALCSRASRSRDDLRLVFLNEFVKPFGETAHGQAFLELVSFLHRHPFEEIFANPKARDFYIKWLAEYGDDSIAQMSGCHLVFASISQIAIKHFENQRIALAPIEKSTRYVDFSKTISGHYLYFTPPEIADMGLERKYEEDMNYIFDTYRLLFQKYFDHLKKFFPNEKDIVIKTKVFDTIRTILPMATLSQVAFFGNGQSFEYLINRSLEHHLSEIRWLANRAYEELNKIIPSFLRRIHKEETKLYRQYLSKRYEKIIELDEQFKFSSSHLNEDNQRVRLLEYDPEGEDKIIASLIYSGVNESFDKILDRVKSLTIREKENILAKFLDERKYRWFKIPRAFESVYLRFEIVTNIGAWRDLQRHRMQTQYHQQFSPDNGYEIPIELYEAKLGDYFVAGIQKLEDLYSKIEKFDRQLAQYSVALAHRIRFIQYQNLRQFFWETELRTTSQGHPDYRKIEQEKTRIVRKIYPLIGKYLLVDFNDYDFARRGTIEKIQEKTEELKRSKLINDYKDG
ncbi:MAG: FAD-dependent thymidylate synthase [Patescibacteria group bacterium]|nr:FAD-dependent thymidylate synthase [Patescibacteria group bacterium]